MSSLNLYCLMRLIDIYWMFIRLYKPYERDVQAKVVVYPCLCPTNLYTLKWLTIAL